MRGDRTGRRAQERPRELTPAERDVYDQWRRAGCTDAEAYAEVRRARRLDDLTPVPHLTGIPGGAR